MVPSITEKNKKELNISVHETLLISAVLFLHVYSTKMLNISYLLVGSEVAVVMYYLLKGSLTKAFNILIVLISCSLEVPTFIFQQGNEQPLYSIFRLPVFSYLFFYVVIPLLFVLANLKYKRNIVLSYSGQKDLKIVIKFMFLLFATGFLTGIIALLVNDNGISQFTWGEISFITTSCRYFLMICLLTCASYLLCGSISFKEKLEKTLVELLFGFGVVATVTVILGWHGYLMNIESVMLMPLASSLTPIIMLIPLYYKVKKPFFYYVIAIGFIIESVFYNSLMGSKFYFVPLLCCLVVVVTSVNKGRLKTLLIIFIVIVFLVFNAGDILSLLVGNAYGSWKFNQFLNLFSASTNSNGLLGWYNSIDTSPRFRIDEFVNIVLEYVRKPWYAFFGKGISGSILHTWGTTDWSNTQGAFSEFQISSGLFINMHESINVLFLWHGIMGMIFFISTVKKLLNRLFNSPWAMGGLIWFFFYWNIYITWWVGGIMLVLALCSDGDKAY